MNSGILKFFLLIPALVLLIGCETLTIPNTLSLPKTKSCIMGNCIDGFGTSEIKEYKYSGYFKNGKANGQGTLFYKNGNKYIGNFIKGKFNGEGTFSIFDGEKYQGNFVNGLYHGQGIYTFPDGRQNSGDWIEGKLNGKVKISLKEGDKYIGFYKDDNRNGQGSWIRADKTREEGIWENGLLISKNGEASHTYEDEANYVGSWLDNLRNGYNYISAKLNRGYHCISYNTKSFI